MNMKFTLELNGGAHGSLEISRTPDGTIVFAVLGLETRVESTGTCEAEEFARCAEILTEPTREE